MSWIPIMSVLVRARQLPPELAHLVAKMAGDWEVTQEVSFLDPLMRQVSIWTCRGQEGLNLVKAMIQEKVGIPLEQQILFLAGRQVTRLWDERFCVLKLKLRARVVQNVSLQNVLVANLMSGLLEHSESLLEQQPRGLRMASRSWLNTCKTMARYSGRGTYIHLLISPLNISAVGPQPVG